MEREFWFYSTLIWIIVCVLEDVDTKPIIVQWQEQLLSHLKSAYANETVILW